MPITEIVSFGDRVSFESVWDMFGHQRGSQTDGLECDMQRRS